jgi:hypothetical protein
MAGIVQQIYSVICHASEPLFPKVAGSNDDSPKILFRRVRG